MKTKILIASLIMASLPLLLIYPSVGSSQTLEEKSAMRMQMVYLFYGEGCPYCAMAKEYFDNTLLPANPDVRLTEYEIYHSEDNKILFDRVREDLGITGPGVPITVIGSDYVAGFGGADTSGKAINDHLAACRIKDCGDAVANIDYELHRTEREESQIVVSKTVSNLQMYNRIQGRIILKVEELGRAYYVNPVTESVHLLGSPDNAFTVMREQGIGISNANLKKIRIGLGNLSGTDTDGDGLSDSFEDAIGTDKNAADTDGDGVADKNALENTGSYDNVFAAKHPGKIFLQVESRGEAWYINPVDGKRYFLGRPADAFSVMRALGLGISNKDFDSL